MRCTECDIILKVLKCLFQLRAMIFKNIYRYISNLYIPNTSETNKIKEKKADVLKVVDYNNSFTKSSLQNSFK